MSVWPQHDTRPIEEISTTFSPQVVTFPAEKKHMAADGSTASALSTLEVTTKAFFEKNLHTLSCLLFYFLLFVVVVFVVRQ